VLCNVAISQDFFSTYRIKPLQVMLCSDYNGSILGNQMRNKSLKPTAALP